MNVARAIFCRQIIYQNEAKAHDTELVCLRVSHPSQTIYSLLQSVIKFQLLTDQEEVCAQDWERAT